MKWLASLQALAGLIHRVLDALEAKRRDKKRDAILDDPVGDFNMDYSLRDKPSSSDTPPASDEST